MTEQNIIIHEILPKVSKQNKIWWSINTDKGRMTCHEDEIVKKLTQCKNSNRIASVETQTSGDFVNIRKFLAEIEQRDAQGQEVLVKVNKDSVPEGYDMVKPDKAFDKPSGVVKNTTTMYTSYAKDMFIELINDCKIENHNPTNKEGLKMIMDTACDLIEQARKRFE